MGLDALAAFVKGIITAPIAHLEANVIAYLIPHQGFQIRVKIVIGHDAKTTHVGHEHEIPLLGKPDPGAQPQKRFYHIHFDRQSEVFALGYLRVAQGAGQMASTSRVVFWLYQL